MMHEQSFKMSQIRQIYLCKFVGGLGKILECNIHASYLGCDELLAADLVGLLKHHPGPLHQVALLHRRLVHPGGLQVNLVLCLFNGFLLVPWEQSGG